MFHYRLEHLWLKSVFLQLPYWEKQASAATSASAQDQKHIVNNSMRLKRHLSSAAVDSARSFYLVPKVFCSAAGATGTVRCSSIPCRGCRRGRFGCRRPPGRWQRSQCSAPSGRSPLPSADRRCLPLLAEGNTDGGVPDK